MKVALTLPPHDPEFLDRRGGIELMSHLRAAPHRAEFRQTTIRSAHDRFAAAELDGHSDSEIGGLGLIVLQRALLAAEDLGGLLHALDGDDPWTRLRTTTIADVRRVFEAVAADTTRALTDLCRLATEQELRDTGLDATDVALLCAVRVRIARRWLKMLKSTAVLWSRAEVAKATMHGFPFVSGHELVGPPPAGVLARDIELPKHTRFALALISTSRQTNHVHTAQAPVLLGRQAVARYREDGQTAAQIYRELAEMRTTTTERGVRALIPWGVIHDLGDADRTQLERISTMLPNTEE
jgi:hypothetical protein